MDIRRFIIPLLLIVFMFTLFNSLVGDLLGGDVQDWIYERYGEKKGYAIKWTLALLVILIGATLTVGTIVKNREKEEDDDLSVRKDILDDVRAGLEESYRSRIDSKLAYRYPVNIQLRYSKKGTGKRQTLINKGIKTFGAGAIKDELVKVFDEQGGRLLIIGDPGAGKTTILLQLAIKLMERKEDQIPVVVDISTWRKRFKNVEEWFEELLPQMGFSKALVSEMLSENSILPMFDGLDELEEYARESCLDAIAYYGKRQSVRYVICSRIKEYAGTTDAPVFCQVMVKPLTIEQVKRGLKETNSPESIGILDAINKDPFLAKAIEVPFYLNTVQLLFASMKGVEEFGFKADDVKGRRREIVESFTVEILEELEGYAADDVIRWLGFLADRMSKRRKFRFELVDMQYDMLKWPGNTYAYIDFVSGFVKSAPSGFIMIMMYLLSLIMVHMSEMNVLSFAYKLFISFSILFIALLFLAFFLELRLIYAKDMNSFNLSRIISSMMSKYVGRWMLRALVIFVLSFAIAYMFVGVDLLPVDVLMYMCAYVFFLGWIAFSFFYIINNKYKRMLRVKYPYQRFVGSIKSLHLSILQHWHLCYLLRKNGLIPRRYPIFLNSVVRVNVLENDGGSWRFRHRILQEYFAKSWRREYAEEYPDGLKRLEEA